MVLPARGFTVEEIASAERCPVAPAEVSAYRRNPDRLPDYTFVSTNSEGVEAFRVASILSSSRKEELYYLVFSDEGPEAVAHSTDDFFTLLASSERVLHSHRVNLYKTLDTFGTTESLDVDCHKLKARDHVPEGNQSRLKLKQTARRTRTVLTQVSEQKKGMAGTKVVHSSLVDVLNYAVTRNGSK
ncbi:hypothetical protein B0H13DRAFT_1859285 [Mycena leptocephala]|nr:hypothetical protein B0H13DRAFT_1859285 [Mycena leptocephala]